MSGVSRRDILAGAAATTALLGFQHATAAPLQAPGVYRYRLGDYRLTALYDGVWYLPIDDKFIRNAGGAEVNAALDAAFLPPNVLPISFTALLVDTGRRLILIDTGTAGQIADTAGSMIANLAAAGASPDRIDTILISHFHPDHIDGLKTKDGAKVFRHAEILVPEPEWAFWMDDGNQSRASGAVLGYFRNARRIFRDIAKEVRRFTPGRRGRARHCVGAGLWPHTRPYRLRHSFRRPVAAGDERHRAQSISVRPPSGLAAFVRYGRTDGGSGPPPHARPGGGRPHAGRGLSFPLPGLRPYRPHGDGLRAGARGMVAALTLRQ